MNAKRIDKDFIENLRLNPATTIWGFGKIGPNKIVPKELAHDYLINNFIIDKGILAYYCLPSSRLVSESEFQEMVKHGYAGNRETSLLPYSNIIFGAYHSRVHLELGLWQIVFSSGKNYTISSKPIRYFSDLTPYFKEYAKGFKDGFIEFDNRKVKPYLTMFAGQNDYVNKVFECLTTNFLFSGGWLSTSGFTIDQDNEIVNAFEKGQQQGYFYKAWSIVFSNNILFAPLFQNLSTTLPHKQKPEPNGKYTAKHYLLAYLFECHTKGEIHPVGNKKELERIGNERMGPGKGNRFYKVFNEITNQYDINIENQLIEIGGNNWRKAVIELSKTPELVEKYLQSKQL